MPKFTCFGGNFNEAIQIRVNFILYSRGRFTYHLCWNMGVFFYFTFYYILFVYTLILTVGDSTESECSFLFYWNSPCYTVTQVCIFSAMRFGLFTGILVFQGQQGLAHWLVHRPFLIIFLFSTRHFSKSVYLTKIKTSIAEES